MGNTVEFFAAFEKQVVLLLVCSQNNRLSCLHQKNVINKDLFNTRGPTPKRPDGTLAYQFCKELLKAGKKGLTREEVKGAIWNKNNRYHFDETYDRLVEENLAYPYSRFDKHLLTPKGIEVGNKWEKK